MRGQEGGEEREREKDHRDICRALAAQAGQEMRRTLQFIARYLRLMVASLHIGPVNKSVGASRFSQIRRNTNISVDTCAVQTASCAGDEFQQAGVNPCVQCEGQHIGSGWTVRSLGGGGISWSRYSPL